MSLCSNFFSIVFLILQSTQKKNLRETFLNTIIFFPILTLLGTTFLLIVMVDKPSENFHLLSLITVFQNRGRKNSIRIRRYYYGNLWSSRKNISKFNRFTCLFQNVWWSVKILLKTTFPLGSNKTMFLITVQLTTWNKRVTSIKVYFQ